MTYPLGCFFFPVGPAAQDIVPFHALFCSERCNQLVTVPEAIPGLSVDIHKRCTFAYVALI
jgi:hypothetical protein